MNKITTKMKRHVKHELKYEGPTLWVGKEGLTEQVLAEVEKQLNKQRMIKIRILRTALQDETAQKIASHVSQQTNSALVEVRGHVFILYRKRKASAQNQETDKTKPPKTQKPTSI